MPEFLIALGERVPPIDYALAAAVVVSGGLAWSAARRGGRFRGLDGWAWFWVVFAALLVCLSRASRWVSYPMLAALMFVALRSYFFVAPVRPQDRYAILAAYLAIPFALGPAFAGSNETFLATVPVALFLIIPVFLSIGSSEQGLLDSMGRTLLGVLFFVFCIAHLSLLARQEPAGLLELFGVLVLAAELPRRLTRRIRDERGWFRPGLGLGGAVVLSSGLGWLLGPWCGLSEEDGARAGMLVMLAVTMGTLVSNAVWRDLVPTPTTAHYGRGAFLNRIVPAVYAAPVYFHYLNHFA